MSSDNQVEQTVLIELFSTFFDKLTQNNENKSLLNEHLNKFKNFLYNNDLKLGFQYLNKLKEEMREYSLQREQYSLQKINSNQQLQSSSIQKMQNELQQQKQQLSSQNTQNFVQHQSIPIIQQSLEFSQQSILLFENLEKHAEFAQLKQLGFSHILIPQSAGLNGFWIMMGVKYFERLIQQQDKVKLDFIFQQSQEKQIPFKNQNLFKQMNNPLLENKLNENTVQYNFMLNYFIQKFTKQLQDPKRVNSYYQIFNQMNPENIVFINSLVSYVKHQVFEQLQDSQNLKLASLLESHENEELLEHLTNIIQICAVKLNLHIKYIKQDSNLLFTIQNDYKREEKIYVLHQFHNNNLQFCFLQIDVQDILKNSQNITPIKQEIQNDKNTPLYQKNNHSVSKPLLNTNQQQFQQQQSFSIQQQQWTPSIESYNNNKKIQQQEIVDNSNFGVYSNQKDSKQKSQPSQKNQFQQINIEENIIKINKKLIWNNNNDSENNAQNHYQQNNQLIDNFDFFEFNAEKEEQCNKPYSQDHVNADYLVDHLNFLNNNTQQILNMIKENNRQSQQYFEKELKQQSSQQQLQLNNNNPISPLQQNQNGPVGRNILQQYSDKKENIYEFNKQYRSYKTIGYEEKNVINNLNKTEFQNYYFNQQNKGSQQKNNGNKYTDVSSIYTEGDHFNQNALNNFTGYEKYNNINQESILSSKQKEKFRNPGNGYLGLIDLNKPRFEHYNNNF